MKTLITRHVISRELKSWATESHFL